MRGAERKLDENRSGEFCSLRQDVFYTSVRHKSVNPGSESRGEIKRLVARSLMAFAIERGMLRANSYELDDRILDIQKDSLGRPTLKGFKNENWSISFSYGREKLWGAICYGNLNCGIDVAYPEEFTKSYPFHRAFSDSELYLLSSSLDLNAIESAAFAWSAKESVVKALGVGFHFCDPLDLEVTDVQSFGRYFEARLGLTVKPKLKATLNGFTVFKTMVRHDENGFLSLSATAISNNQVHSEGLERSIVM
ncbi:MAG: 4'-phosphopantetheinyl transferase superfamily protein [Desulfomonilaceae bacterium]|jgi:phosphopantetheinyl transferase